MQVPTVEGIGRDSALLYEAESEEVVIARDTFASLRQYLVTLQEEVGRGNSMLYAFQIISWQIPRTLACNPQRISCCLHFVEPLLLSPCLAI